MIRRNPDQLLAGLRRGLAPVYLVTGEEPLQRMECVDAVRAAARAQGFEDRIVFDSSTGIDWTALRFEAASMSLFASRRIIEIRLHEAKVGAEGAEALRGYCAEPAADTLLLIAAPKFDSRGQAAEWYKAIDRAGEVVQVWPVKPEEMPRWVAKRLQARGLAATPEAVRLLAERVEGNLLAAVQDIEKLALIAGPEPIDADTVLAAVGDSARFDLFSLADTALSGEAERCVRILNGLRDEGAEPVLICWALTRELRAASLLCAGMRPEQGITGYRMFGPREGTLRAAGQRLGLRPLRRLLRRATRVDRIVKGAAPGDAWGELVSLCLAAAGRPVGGSAWIP
ncbi:MAG: DNA polymerase III subunit delta [Gammaproteobacteria bacterium]